MLTTRPSHEWECEFTIVRNQRYGTVPINCGFTGSWKVNSKANPFFHVLNQPRRSLISSDNIHLSEEKFIHFGKRLVIWRLLEEGGHKQSGLPLPTSHLPGDRICALWDFQQSQRKRCENHWSIYRRVEPLRIFQLKEESRFYSSWGRNWGKYVVQRNAWRLRGCLRQSSRF